MVESPTCENVLRFCCDHIRTLLKNIIIIMIDEMWNYKASKIYMVQFKKINVIVIN